MISELLSLVDALESNNVPYKDRTWSEKMRTGAKATPAYWIKLNREGKVVSVLPIGKEKWQEFRFYSSNNHNSFPATRLFGKKKLAIVGTSLLKNGEIVAGLVGDEGHPLVQTFERLTKKTEEVLIEAKQQIEEAEKEKQSKRRKSKKTKEKPIDAYAVFDIDGPASVLDESSSRLLNQRLSQEVPSESCQITISGVGKITIFSKNKLIPSVCRYGVSGASFFPITNEDKRNIFAALQWLLCEDNKDKTWVKREGEVQILYVASDEELISKLLLTEEDFVIGEFVEQTGRVVKALKALSIQKPTAQVNSLIFEITQGGVVVSLSRQYSVQELIVAVEQWQEGTQLAASDQYRIPDLQQFISFMSHKYTFHGNRRDSRAFDAAVAQDFFFGIDYAVQNVTKLFARNHLGLLRSKFGTKDFWIGCSVMSLIIHKNGLIEEKQVVEHWAYKVGQLLALGNFIQKRYFQSRKCRIPPELIGFNHLNRIAQNPQTGFVLFLKKINRIYVNWAESNEFGLYKKYQEILAGLDVAEIPTKTKHVEELLIYKGYVSRLFPEKKQQS